MGQSMFSIAIEDLDEKSHSRCGSLKLGALDISLPAKVLNSSELRVLNSVGLDIPQTLFVKTLHLNPKDLFILSKSPRKYKKKVRVLASISRRVRKTGGEFLLIPHLNKKAFRRIEKQDPSALNTLVHIQTDSGSSSIVIPDYWKYTSGEYEKYLGWWMRAIQDSSKPILASIFPSEKETRIRKRVRELSDIGINGILVNMLGNINHSKFTATFTTLHQFQDEMEKLWIHSYDTPKKIFKMLCAEQTIIPLLGSDTVSAREPGRLVPKVREQLALKGLRGFDIQTNGILGKEDYRKFHSSWECQTHTFCREETLETIYEKSKKLKAHSIWDQMILVGNFYEWIKEEIIISEMKERVFSKQFISRTPLLEGGLRRWST